MPPNIATFAQRLLCLLDCPSRRARFIWVTAAQGGPHSASRVHQLLD
jgi:hypothetical protein